MNTPDHAAPFRPLPFVARDIAVDRRDDGTLLLRSRLPLEPGPPHVPAMFARSAAAHPDRVWLAQRRGADRAWQALRYGEARRQVDSVTERLLRLQRPGRTVVVLSGNSLEQAVFQLAAMQARMPFVPVTPAYSLLAEDFVKLRHMVDLVEPAVVFVQSGKQFERALRALQLPADVVTVAVDDPLGALGNERWSDWIVTPAGGGVAESVARIEPSTVAKYLFTSGSTGVPKAVIVTQKMLSQAVAMHLQMFTDSEDDHPAVQLNWMPWSHVAAGNVVFNNNLAQGGTLYLDDGRPVPGAFAETIRNLREIPPENFSSVPIGFTMLVDALEADPALAQNFFRRLNRLGYSGARLPDSINDRIQTLAVRHTGHRIAFVSGYGSTETSAAVTLVHWNAGRVGLIGLPHPGVELKLLPLEDGRFEVRVRSAAVTPGYLNNPEQTRAAFDEEGFFRMGDAVAFVDPDRPEEGLAFAGRVSEEFKLLSGIFVRVGTLRVEALESAGGLLADVVVAGADQPHIGVLVWPNLAACRQRCGNPGATMAELASAPWLRDALREAFALHNVRHPASSMRIRRAVILTEPPSLGSGEITDKGYVNQRTVLQRRSAQVDQLFAPTPDSSVIVID